MAKRLLRYHELKLEKGVPFARQHLSRLERDRKFPTRVQIGANAVAWWEHGIDEWLEARERGPLPIRVAPSGRGRAA